MSLLRFTSFLLLFAISNLSLAVEAPLVWKFRVGDEHHFRMTQDMGMEMLIGEADRKIETSMKQTLNMTWKVEQLDEQGLASLVQKIDRIQMDMEAPGQQKIHYDTNSDESPAGFAAMLAPLYKAMTAEPFKLTMTSRGEIKDLDAPEALAKAMKAVPGAAAMGEMFSGEGFKNMMQKSSLILPEPQDLQPGHEWTTKTEMKNPQIGVINIEATYRYIGPRDVEGKTFEVFRISMEINFGEAPVGMEMEITSQEAHGEILFNREDGLLESSKMQQVMETSITAAGQEMAQTINQTMTFERVEKESLEQDQ